MVLAYNREGTGARTILLVTGLGGHANFWNAHRPKLAERFTVLSFDQRGCGANRAREGVHTLQEIVGDAIDILAEAEASRVTVVGHSMGGVIAQCLVLDHPELFEAAVFSGTFCAFDRYMEFINDLRQRVLDAAGTVTCGHLSAILAMPGGDVLDPNYDLMGRIQNITQSMADEVLSARMRAPYKFDRREELRSVELPSLVIGASDDMLAAEYQSREIAALIKGARLEIMNGGHFFPNTRPQRYWEILEGFLRSTDR
ncbi:hydrolase [Mesorhizobium huakuii]|uniref:alpha/beta fold hydrolase n=1 Tax=Mesorhizobium huakuii TaxID=28104 RepID=UPI00235CA87E|nr:alpha/beta hydrolase [Mesorhizobium huakuii]GLQ80798.1 hydrolase [Mesorhizobium huakuii]